MLCETEVLCETTETMMIEEQKATSNNQSINIIQTSVLEIKQEKQLKYSILLLTFCPEPCEAIKLLSKQ